jgi:ribosomal protein S12 methylthiotransferase accessory factor
MTATESFIPGKDASLEASIHILLGKLDALDFHIEERSWLNPVEGVWSVHIRDRDCTLLFSNGKGGSELAARASALGEFFERLSTNYFWTHFYLGETLAERAYVHSPEERWFALDDAEAWPVDLLTAELQAVYNPDGSVRADQLIDLNSGNAERGICALPYRRLRDDALVYFPVNLIGNLYVSNGMSAGNTLAEARTQALSEIFERHIKFRIIQDGLCLPDVPEAVIARYPRIAAGIRDLRAAGFGIVVKDASLGGQFPVMNVTLLHPDDQGCFASFGAHPRFEVALERALTELLQGRALDALAGFPAPGFDQSEIADAKNLEIHFVDSSGVIAWDFLRDTPDYPFVDWNFGTTTEEDYAWSCAAIQAAGHELYIADFTHLGVYACRILVPGVSEIYPMEELEFDNNSVGNLIRPALARLPELSDEECADLFDLILDLELADDRLVSVLIGLAAEPESPWSGLRIGELKLLLALALGDDDAILEGCAWMAQYGQRSPARLKVYRCIADLVRLAEPVPFEPALALLYGSDTLNQAFALFNQDERFFGLTTLGADFQGSPIHQRLLAAYRKVRA